MNDLNSLMHASVDGERPDVDRLLAGAIRDGQRLQRRRRMSYAGVGLAVAAIASAGAVVAGSQAGSDTATDDLVPAASSSPSGPAPLQAGRTFDLGRGVTGTVLACTAGKPDRIGGNPECILPKQYYIPSWSTISGPGTGFAILLTGPHKTIVDFSSQGFQSTQLAAYQQGLAFALPADDPLIQSVYQGQDVAIDLPGWKLVGPIADDKETIQGPDGAVAGIVWRPAKDHAEWVSSSDKGANAGTWVSDVHDGVFVSIQSGLGTTAADIEALGASLSWK